MVGIIVEQHPERCRLFMQWKQMSWPILVDSLNRLGVSSVPITMLIDESGIIRAIRPNEADFDEFLNKAYETDPSMMPFEPPMPDLALLREETESDDDTAWRTYGDSLVEWGGDLRLGDAIAAYEQAVQLDPANGSTYFRLGVAYRKRYDSPRSRASDFADAVESWAKALEIDPNQYIWRRRIQQYGPRLDKPYPFYDWIHQARDALQARGESPVGLPTEPGGAEFTSPRKSGLESVSDHQAPDPMGRIARDTRRFINVETTVVPSTDASHRAARVHLVFRPNKEIAAHWNNEAEGLIFWVDPPVGWQVNRTYHEVPNPPEAVSSDPRKIEFEMDRPASAPGAATMVRGYALYYVCEDVDGTCLYRRQDVEIRVPW